MRELFDFEVWCLNLWFHGLSQDSDSLVGLVNGLNKLELDLWAWQLPFAIFVLGWCPGVLQNAGGQFLTILRLGNVMVLSEVWHKVVSLDRWVLLHGKNVTVMLLGPLERISVVEDLLVSAEMWHEIVSGWVLGWILNYQFMTKLLLRPCNIVLGSSDVGILAKMRHTVVHVERVLLRSWRPGKKWLTLQRNGRASRNQCNSS